MVGPTADKRKRDGGRPDGAKRVFYIILALLLIAGITALSYMASRSRQAFTIDSTAAPIPNQGHVIGSESALVEVVEFADFECPACGQFAIFSEPDIRTRLVNTGQIRFRFLDYPLPQHRNTMSAHSAAWCASDQGKFWEMHDIIFQNQDRWSTYATTRPAGVLEGLARQIGLDLDQYKSCMSSGKFYPQIRANLDEAGRRQVQSTPTFFIGNKRVTGHQPYDQFKKLVDEAIAQARQTK